MIKLTDRAVLKIKSMLKEKNQKNHSIRIGARGEEKCAMNFYIGIQKQPLPDDIVYDYQGITVITDRVSETRMMNIELDYIEISHGSGFVFRNRSKSDLNE